MPQDNYGDFANFYDEATSTDNRGKIKLFKAWIAKYVPEAKSILELGVGTANILTAFADEFDIVGLDLSAEMLYQASLKLPPETKLVQGNMANFKLGQQFDVILCVFDSINHLLKFSQWESTFLQASRHLQAQGLFIFDIITRSKLTKRSKVQSFRENIGEIQVTAQIKYENNNIYIWHIDVYNTMEDVHKYIQIPEAVFPIKRVEKAAKRYFSEVQTTTGTTEPANEAAERIYFVCRHPR